MCKHEWYQSKIISNNGIVFVYYICENCNMEVEQTIGETWAPDQQGNFE